MTLMMADVMNAPGDSDILLFHCNLSNYSIHVPIVLKHKVRSVKILFLCFVMTITYDLYKFM